MFLIKQLYKQLPSPKQLHIALENRFHLITSFQLGDISKEHEIRKDLDDYHMGTIPVILFKVIYYILLGFSCIL